MDREIRGRSGAMQVAQGQTHKTFHLDGLSEAGEYQTTAPGTARLFIHAIGAVVSLALIGGGVWWGYKQIMRDVHGVPVVRALDGPMREAPENPGGQVAANEGLSVNDVQAVGVASAPESQLQLAPAPVELTEADASQAELLAAAPKAEAVVLNGDAEADDAALVDGDKNAPVSASLSQDVPDGDPVSKALALAEAATAGATPLAPVSDGALIETASVAVPTDVALATGPGLPKSARPAPRPARRVVARNATTAEQSSGGQAVIQPASLGVTDMAAVEAAVLAAATVPTGTRMVQLGAFDNSDDAIAEWNRIATKFDGMLDDKIQVVQETKGGGRDLYRLRAMGFTDLSDARRFCAALTAERVECIPVVSR